LKVLLDHCVPRRFGARLEEHNVLTAASQGWSDLRNGQLLKEAAANGFQALVTVDQNLLFQQRTSDLPLAVVVMICRTNRMADLEKLVEPLRAALKDLVPNSVVRIG